MELRQRGIHALPDLIAAVDTKDSPWADLYRQFYQAVPKPVQQRLREPTSPVHIRHVAALHLASLGAASEPAVPALIQMIQNTNIFDWVRASDAMGAIGPNARSATPHLLRWLGATNEQLRLRLHAAGALARIHPGQADAGALLLAGLNDTNPIVRVTAARQFPETEEAKRIILPVLIDLMKGTDNAAFGALIAVQELDKESQRKALPGLIAMLEHQNGYHDHVASILSGLGSDAHAAMLALLNAARTGSVRLGIAELALRQIGPPTAAELPEVAGFLNDSDPKIRILVIEQLRRVSSDLRLILPQLKEALKDEDPKVRRIAEELLIRSGKNPRSE